MLCGQYASCLCIEEKSEQEITKGAKVLTHETVWVNSNWSLNFSVFSRVQKLLSFHFLAGPTNSSQFTRAPLARPFMAGMDGREFTPHRACFRETESARMGRRSRERRVARSFH